jgi:predicted NUDIX family NTP pyrophosphohydrolase
MSSRPKRSAGLLMYRRPRDGQLEVLLAHPGGPLFARKDAGAWTIPKGELEAGEEPRDCAVREFSEETGLRLELRDYLELGTIKQRGGKLVSAWAFEGDCEPSQLRSNSFTLEWPPRSGRLQAYPELDRFGFFALEAAREKLNPAQTDFLDRLRLALASV